MHLRLASLSLAIAAAFAVPGARADVVTDWNRTTTRIVADAKVLPPMANRAVALVQTAVYEAANAITRKYPARGNTLNAPDGASLDAAVAAATRVMLLETMPSQQAAVDAAYTKAIAKIDDGASRRDGIAVGEQAARAVLESRRTDAVSTVEQYRPATQPGVYVPTMLPAVPQWPARTPWLLNDAKQLRPGPPPALDSETWARDYNEVKDVGGRTGSKRTDAQTGQARFWEATLPIIYFGVVNSVADQPGRDVTRNARLMMAAAQAMDDALIAVFDAKYHYNFWRPVTAIRNGDIDGNPATERAPSWVPFIDTPMHPEYPCAHCIVASSMGTVLKYELGTEAVPVLATTSYTAGDMRREWKSVDEFVQEVADARVYDGVHYRTSTQVAIEMGRKVGELAAERHLKGAP